VSAQTPSANPDERAESRAHRAHLEGLGDPVALLESIFAFAPVGFQIFRMDGRSLVVNDAFRRLFGVEPPPDYNVLHDEIAARAGVLNLIHRAFAGETIRVPATWYDPRELEHVRVTEGRRVAIEATFFPLVGPGGAVEHVGITFKDVTDEVLAREALLLERDRLALLVKAGDTLSSSIDYDTTLHNVAGLAMPTLADFCFFDVVEQGGDVRRIARSHENPAIQAILGQTRWARSERKDINVCALSSGESGFHPDIDDAWYQNVAVSPGHLDLMRELAFCSLMTVPLKLQDRLLGSLTVCFAESRRHHSIEDLRLAEELARRAAVAVENARLYRTSREATLRAEEASRSREEFLSVVSHELRTPLNAIIGWTNILTTREGDRELLGKGLRAIDRNARAQVRIIGDILDVSRIATGKLRLSLHPVDLAPVLRGAVDAVRLAAEAKKVALALALSSACEAQSIAVLGDPERLHQVALNLLTNAIKFTPSGGQVTLTVEVDATGVLFSVSDTGIGISPEVLPRVFDRFWQADSSATRAQGGLGLGLALVRYIVEMHGGSVRGESEGPGKGATFVVRLPTSSALIAVQVAEGDRGSAPGEAPFDRGGAELQGLRVLVVDDDPDARDVTARIFGIAGAEVAVAGSAAEALEAVKASCPDILVSDIGMPERDGYWLLRSIRALPPPAGGIAAVALTAYAAPEDIDRAIHAGFRAHIAKPAVPDALVEAVAEIVGRRPR
jgi:signal transduction histidine kinase/CheY-like chemotaxis protein